MKIWLEPFASIERCFSVQHTPYRHHDAAAAATTAIVGAPLGFLGLHVVDSEEYKFKVLVEKQLIFKQLCTSSPRVGQYQYSEMRP